MNEIIAKLEAEKLSLLNQQDAALKAADAEGCSAEDRAKHLKEFDDLQAKVDAANASISRHKKAASNRSELEAGRTEPARPAVHVGLHNPHAATGRVTIPSNVRRNPNLKAFKGADAQDKAYRCGLFVAAALYGHAPSRERYVEMFGAADFQQAPQAATLSDTSNTAGGYFVPEAIDYAVVELAEQFGMFRRLAERVPMSTETVKSPRWTTGQTAYWIAQGNSPTQSDPAWDMIELVAKDLATMSKMLRQLNEDAIIDLGDKVAMASAVAFAEGEDDAGFNGTGTSTYGGITGLLTKLVLAANAASLVTATGHTTLGALTLTDFWTVVGKLPRYPGIMPVWMCHQEVYAASMGPLQTAAGGVTAQDIANGGTPKFLGYPVEFCQKMPRAASVTSGVTGIAFGDLGMAAKFGDRRQRTFETGFVNTDFTDQKITLLCTERVDINIHTIVDPRNSSNPGPVLGLKLG